MVISIFAAFFFAMVVLAVRLALRAPKTNYLDIISTLLSAQRYTEAAMYVQNCDPDRLRKEFEYYLKRHYKNRSGYAYCNVFELYRIVFNKRPKHDYLDTIEKWASSTNTACDAMEGTLSEFRKAYLGKEA